MPVSPQTPIVKFLSPDKRDRGLIEFWSSEPTAYQPLDLGAAHPNTRDFAGYKLGKQFNLPNDNRFVVRIWVTDATGPQWFDYAIRYLGESAAHPIFVRNYRKPRNTYTPRTKGQPLTSVYKLSLNDPGSGYIVGSFPALTFSGGAGSGAAGHAVVNPDGTIAEFVLDSGGTGYTSSPTFTVEAPPSGTTATGTAVIQPATALLTTEQADEYPDDSEFRGLYLNVTRVYETLPGPWIPFTRYDDDLGPIQGQRRAVLNSGQVTTLGATSKTTYEGRDGSSVVLLEIQETWSDGTGGTGNPAYPIDRTNFYDAKRGAVAQTKQIVTDTTSEGSLTVTAGVATWIRYEPFEQNPALRRKITETWSLPGPLRLEQPKYDPERGQITSTAQLVENTGQTGTRTATQDIQYRPSEWGIAIYDKITESWNSNRPDRAGHAWDDTRGDVAQTLENVSLTGSEVASLTVSAGVATQIDYKPIDAFSADKITDTWALPGPILRDKERYDELRGFITSTRRLVENTSQTQTEDSAGRVRYEASPFGSAVLWRVAESWDTAAFPPRTKDGFDDERGAFQTVSKLKVAAGTEVGSLAVAAGVATLINFEPVNEFLVDKQTTTWAVPGPLRLLSPKYDPDRGQITSTIQLVENTGQTGTRIATKDTQYQPSKWGAALVSEVIEDWVNDMPDKPAHAWDDARGNVDQVLEQIPIGAGGQTASLTVTSGVATQIYYKPVDEFQIQKITESWALPGPVLRDKERYDERYGKIASTRRLVENTSQVLTETASGRTRYEASGFGAAVLWQITESWDNTAFPIRTDDGHDAERGAYQVATRLVVAAGTEAGSLAVATGVATLIEYKAVNAFLLDKSTTTWAVPGPLLRNQERYDAALGLITGTRQLYENLSQTQTASESSQVRYEPSPYGTELLWRVAEAWDTAEFPVQTSTEFEKDGVKKVVTRQLAPVGDIVTDETLAAGVLTREFSERYSEFLAFQVIETITVIDDDLLDLPAFVTSIPNLIPEVFRALLATHVESHIIEGIATEAALATGEFEHSERQLTPLYKEVRSTVLDDIGSLPITITGEKETNAKKQVVTVAMKLCLDSTTPTVPTALIDVDFKKLGNGLAVEITKTIPSVFDNVAFTAQRDDNWPARFRAEIAANTEHHTIAGTAAEPTLAAGDLEATERQLDDFTKETSVTNRDDGDPPILHGQEYDQTLDVVLPYDETIEPAGTSIGTNRRIVEPLGGGDDLVRSPNTTALTAALDAYVLSYPGTTNLTLPDVLESVTGIIEKTSGVGFFHEDGFANWSGHGSASLSLRGNGQSSAAIIPDLDPQIRQTWGNNVPMTHRFFFLPLPVTAADVLVKLTRLAVTGATVTITIASPGVVTWTSHGLSDGNTVTFTTTGALPTGLSSSVVYYVVSSSTNNFRVALTAGGTAINTSGSQSGVHTARATVNAWPRFSPVAHTFTLVGQRLSLRCDASASWQDGGSDSSSEHSESGGTGASQEVGLTVRTVRVPPTIHGAITVGGTTSDTQDITASAQAIADAGTGTSFISEDGSVAGSITPTTLSATSHTTAIPTTGLYLLHTDADPYKWGYARIHCEVVDFADVG